MDTLPLECPECGKRFPLGSRFCPHDGAELLESGAPTLVFDTDKPRGKSFGDIRDRSAGMPQHSSSSGAEFEEEYTHEDDRVPSRVPSALPPPIDHRGRLGPQKDPLVGALVGSYRVEGLLGQGGMGRIYRAMHTTLGKYVAIKVLRKEVARDSEANTRFIREARSMSALGHPNIVDVLDFGALEDGRAYFVMELLEGASLYQVIQTLGRLEPRRALRMAERLASALQAAHSQGVVHRDLKPGNVFVCGDIRRSSEVKLLDFGIAKIADATIRLTVAGSIFGTPQYMAPEQCVGVEVDHRADIYALGVMLFEMLTGAPPFDNPVPVEILIMQRSSPIPNLPPRLAALQPLMTRVLAKDPAERFQTMREFGVALDDASDSFNAPAPLQPPIAKYPSAQASHPSAQQPPRQGSGASQVQPKAQARTVQVDYGAPPAGTVPAPYTTAAPAPISPSAPARPPAQPPAQPQRIPAAPGRSWGRVALLILGGLSALAIGAMLVITFGSPNEEIAPHITPLAPAALINVVSEPAGAQLYSGETLVGVTPCPVSRPSADQEFRASLSGHAALAFTLGPSSPDVYSFVLAPSSP